MPRIRPTDTSLQAILAHGFSIAVVIANHLVTVEHIIGTQPHDIGFLAVCPLALFRCLVLRLSPFASHYRNDGGVEMWRVLVHVENHRHDILLAERVLQPLQAVVAPIVKLIIGCDVHHVLVRSRQHGSNHPHLVIGYLALDACRLDAVGDGFVTTIHTARHLDKLTVEVSSRRVSVVGYHLALYVV
ncbi:uncharacterized protein BN510_01885 [Segatella copri CAG:164]|nr:uncharacterized protein BN510_01885 [Segatella copri CAG:164]